MDKFKALSNQSKTIIFSSAIVILLLSGFAYTCYNKYTYNQQVTASQIEADSETKELAGIAYGLKSLEKKLKSGEMDTEAVSEELQTYQAEYVFITENFSVISRDVYLVDYERTSAKVETMIEELEQKLKAQK